MGDDYHFVPVAVETLGSWGNIGHKFIKDIGKMIAANTKDSKSTSYIFQAISIAIQKGNVQCVQNVDRPSSRSVTSQLMLFEREDAQYSFVS